MTTCSKLDCVCVNNYDYDCNNVSAVFIIFIIIGCLMVTQNGGRSSVVADDQTTGESEYEGAKYKKVAIVEDFFDIIYNVHVEMDGRGGKHAGQKRTYRAVSLCS